MNLSLPTSAALLEVAHELESPRHGTDPELLRLVLAVLMQDALDAGMAPEALEALIDMPVTAPARALLAA